MCWSIVVLFAVRLVSVSESNESKWMMVTQCKRILQWVSVGGLERFALGTRPIASSAGDVAWSLVPLAWVCVCLCECVVCFRCAERSSKPAKQKPRIRYALRVDSAEPVKLAWRSCKCILAKAASFCGSRNDAFEPADHKFIVVWHDGRDSDTTTANKLG